MNVRENTLAMLHYENYDKIPVAIFGYWQETIDKWKNEGKLKDGDDLRKILGYDFSYAAIIGPSNRFLYPFESKVNEDLGDGWYIAQNADGLIEKKRKGVVSIAATVDTLLKDRKSWETLYKPRLQFDKKRLNFDHFREMIEYHNKHEDFPIGAHAGSMYGFIRDMLGVENLAYLQADDEDLLIEIIDTVGELNYKCDEGLLSSDIKLDFIHFWEDICFKNGPLVNPKFFEKYVVPKYKRITDLYRKAGVDLVFLDCDGLIDELVPLWLKGGVNVMFPIEVGTWGGNIETWRKKYGKEIRGLGGMDKRVFAQDYNAIDKEIERLKHLIDLGGFVPCVDHLIPPDAIFENVQYYCDKMQNLKV